LKPAVIVIKGSENRRDAVGKFTGKLPVLYQ